MWYHPFYGGFNLIFVVNFSLRSQFMINHQGRVVQKAISFIQDQRIFFGQLSDHAAEKSWNFLSQISDVYKKGFML